MTLAAPPSLEALARGVELLSLDAGNTVIFLDHGRLARLLVDAGYDIDVARLVEKEGETKRRLESDTVLRPAWKHLGARGAVSWGNTVGTIVHLAGVPESDVPRVLELAWRSHVDVNFWSLVPAGLVEALDAARASGVKVVIVSNSEGMLEPLFERLGVLRAFDRVIDSALVGVEKPDPAIFAYALAPFGVAPDRALHLGDTFATDVLGAERAGLRYALIDPHGHYEGRHPGVARVSGVVEVANALVAARTR